MRSDSSTSLFSVQEEGRKVLHKLVRAMCSVGYGSWAKVRSFARLSSWRLSDVAKACRHVLLQLLCWASMPARDDDATGAASPALAAWRASGASKTSRTSTRC